MNVDVIKVKESPVPYSAISDLPDNVQDVLPKHAQEIYKEACNSALEQYKHGDNRDGNESQEEAAHKVAWSAVKKAGYSKGDDDMWHKNSKE